MDIEGTYTLQASPEEVWRCLMDQQTLQRTIPGVEHIETLDKDRYAITVQVGPTPLTGSYHGHVTVAERQYPYYYRLAIEGEGCQRTINGEGSVHLGEQGENTIVTYKGELTLSKSNTTLPIPVVKGAAKLLIQQFFTSLDDQLHAIGRAPAMTVEHVHGVSILERPRGKIVLLPALPQPTLLETIVRRLGLGAGDPAAEAQWANRIMRGSIALGVLLLVWIASRILRGRYDKR